MILHTRVHRLSAADMDPLASSGMDILSCCSMLGAKCSLLRRRGTLVPLYPTLSGQIARIAREYGLPSAGGIVVYLMELSTNGVNGTATEAFVGPRVGDEAWNLLWHQLFKDERVLSEEDESLDGIDMDASTIHTGVPSMPPFPSSRSYHFPSFAPGKAARNEIRSQSPSEHHSDVSSIADSSSISALASDDVRPNISSTISPSATRIPRSSNDPLNEYHRSPSSPDVRPHSSASRTHRPHGRQQPSSSHQSPSLRGRSSQHSLSTTRFNVTNGSDAPEIPIPIYGEAVIVGKLEFDIDRLRGGGRWYDAWLESASLISEAISAQGTPISSSKSVSRRGPGDTYPDTLLKQRAQSLKTTPITQPNAMNMLARENSAINAMASGGSSSKADSSRSVASRDSPQTEADREEVRASILPKSMAGFQTLPSPTIMDRDGLVEEEQPNNFSLEPHLAHEHLLDQHIINGPVSVPEDDRNSNRPRSVTSSDSAPSLDALNATPRVIAPAHFSKSTSRTSSPSPTSPHRRYNGLGREQSPSSTSSAKNEREDPLRQSSQRVHSDSIRSLVPPRSTSATSSNSSMSISAADDSETDEADVSTSVPIYEQLVDEEEDGHPTHDESMKGHEDALTTSSEHQGNVTSSSEQGDELSFGNLQYQHDPLRDVFPSDAATWADIKSTSPYTVHEDLGNGETSPIEVHDAPSGLGILSPPLHGISASASSSLDPFEFDNDPAANAIASSPIAKPEDDVREVMNMLQAHSLAKNIGLSSPIILDEFPKQISYADHEVISATAMSQPEHVSGSQVTSSSSKHLSPAASLSDVHAESITLPLSDSNRSLSDPSRSYSPQYLASSALSSRPSLSEPESVIADPPRATNRGGRIPSAWTSAFSSTLRSRKNSQTTDSSEFLSSPIVVMADEAFTSRQPLPMLHGETPQRSIAQYSPAELAAEMTRSRSSSVEMMDSLDEIERALAELSPRSVRPSPGVAIVGVYPFHWESREANRGFLSHQCPPLAASFQQKTVPPIQSPLGTLRAAM